MNVIQLKYGAGGYDLAKDGRFQSKEMKLQRRDQKFHPFEEELTRLVNHLCQEFTQGLGRALSSEDVEVVPVLPNFTNRQLRGQFEEQAAIALLEQWCLQNQELLNELLVRASLHDYQICDSGDRTYGERFVTALNNFLVEMDEEHND